MGADVIFDVILVKARLRMVHNKYIDWFVLTRSLITVLSASILFLLSGVAQADLEEEEGVLRRPPRQAALPAEDPPCHGS